MSSLDALGSLSSPTALPPSAVSASDSRTSFDEHLARIARPPAPPQPPAPSPTDAGNSASDDRTPAPSRDDDRRAELRRQDQSSDTTKSSSNDSATQAANRQRSESRRDRDDRSQDRDQDSSEPNAAADRNRSASNDKPKQPPTNGDGAVVKGNGKDDKTAATDELANDSAAAELQLSTAALGVVPVEVAATPKTIDAAQAAKSGGAINKLTAGGNAAQANQHAAEVAAAKASATDQLNLQASNQSSTADQQQAAGAVADSQAAGPKPIAKPEQPQIAQANAVGLKASQASKPTSTTDVSPPATSPGASADVNQTTAVAQQSGDVPAAPPSTRRPGEQTLRKARDIRQTSDLTASSSPSESEVLAQQAVAAASTAVATTVSSDDDADKPADPAVKAVGDAKDANAKTNHVDAKDNSPATNKPVGSLTTHVGKTSGDGGGTSNGLSDVERVRFVQRVAKAFQSAGEQDGQVRLRLSPPELGSMKLEVTIRDGVLSARMETETPAARNALLENLPQLRERLAEQNIKVDRFDVDLMNQSPGGSADQSQQEQQAAAQRNRLRGDNNAGADLSSARAGTVRTVGNAQLNILI